MSRAQDGTTAVDHTDGSMIYRLTESTLDGALTDSATTVNVDLNTAGLGAAANSYILIGSEVLLVTAVSTNALTVTRGQHGTAPSAHLDGAKVFLLESTLDHTLEIDSTYVSGVEVVAPLGRRLRRAAAGDDAAPVQPVGRRAPRHGEGGP